MPNTKLTTKEENRVVESLQSVVREHWHSVVFPKLKQQKNFENYKEELLILSNVKQFGLIEGALAFTGSLIMMRKVMPLLLTRLGSGTTRNPFSSQKQAIEQPAARLLLDISFSLLAGTYTAIYLVDRKDMLHQLSQVPLVAGQSILADEFCGVIQEFIRKSDYDWKHVENTNLINAHAFALNCSQRQAMERRLKREQGLDEDDSVVIPAGGVIPTVGESEDDITGNETSYSYHNEVDAKDDWLGEFTSDDEDYSAK